MTLGARDTFEALAAVFLATSRALGSKSTSGERPGLRFGCAGTTIPGLNRLMPTAMDPARFDADLDDVLASLAGYPVVSAWIPPMVVPPDAAERFVARGFEPDAEEPLVPAMACSLRDLPRLDLPAGIEVSTARSPDDVRRGCRVVAAAFGGSPEGGDRIADILGDAVLASGASGGLYLVTADGVPVSTALGWAAGPAVAIYNVGTVPAARGRGLGSIATLAAMQHGRDMGAVDAVLESTEAGHAVYRRLGFQDVGDFTVLLRSAPTAPE